ncbi:histidine phosphatase family protein [Lactococcus sp.]|uniref:histidine phosphatase family protein n=1 Tax=Lactococcus sp. TaxID=44273 RepID=UPI0035ADA25F
MKIYFVRHGKTEWNLERKLQGQTGDSPLLEESFESIARVRAYLETLKLDKVIASPAKRAVLTAQLLTDLPVSTDERLAEWNFGQLEGQLIKEAIEQYPEEMHTSRYDLAHFDGSAFGAESVESVLTRFDALGQSLIASGVEEVLLVGHGASGTAGIRHLAGYPVSELRSEGGLTNNSLTILESVGDHFEMKVWNKTIE